mmetsp:Transcript_39442/g.92770  ORF Transcript_39442/g.92770 Transcript_39442/m.92770 type:complete len:442 (+) Transcript_39442:85-1410(+)
MELHAADVLRLGQQYKTSISCAKWTYPRCCAIRLSRSRIRRAVGAVVCAVLLAEACSFVPSPRQSATNLRGSLESRGSAASRAATSVYTVGSQPDVRLDRAEVDHSNPAPLTLALQAMHLSIVAACFFVPWLLDLAVVGIWRWFDSLAITHNPMFEAHLAVASFSLWGICYELIHVWLPNATSYRLDKRPPKRPLRWLPFGPDAHKAAVPAITYLIAIALFHYFGLGVTLFGVKPAFFDDPSFLRVAVEVSLGVFLYDLLFYPFHYTFHNSSFQPWRRQHLRHHQWARTEATAHNAIETVQNDFPDVAIQVAINIFVQQLSPWGFKHPLSRAIHNMMVTYLLVEAHSGYDLPFMSHRLFPGVFGGSPRHEAHHRVGRIYYHQFFTYLDNAFGLTNEGLGHSHKGADETSKFSSSASAEVELPSEDAAMRDLKGARKNEVGQ